MKAGIWIDHSKAVIVSITGKAESVVILESDVNRHFRSAEGKNDGNPNGRWRTTAGDIQDREFAQHISIFYKQVIAALKGAEAVFIFGPGEPKGELAKMALKTGLAKHIAAVEVTGKMTSRQIAAKTRKFFKEQEGTGRSVKPKAKSDSRRVKVKSGRKGFLK